MKASEFETVYLMPPWGYNTDPKLPVYNYTISFWPKLHTRYDKKAWKRWGVTEQLPFTGTVEQAREAAAAFHQLMCIKHGLEE